MKPDSAIAGAVIPWEKGQLFLDLSKNSTKTILLSIKNDKVPSVVKFHLGIFNLTYGCFVFGLTPF